jgi:hypothetical protein
MQRLALVALLLASTPANAAPSLGSLEVVLHPDGAGSFDAFEVIDTGEKLIGIAGGTIDLQRQPGGVRGLSFGRLLNLTCSSTACRDENPAQASFTLTRDEHGYALKGSIGFVLIEAKVTEATLGFTAGGGGVSFGMGLTREPDGSYSGRGSSHAVRSFRVRLSGKGTLKEFAADPALLLALVINPLVGRR